MRSPRRTSSGVRWGALHVCIAWNIYYSQQLKRNAAKRDDGLHGNSASPVSTFPHAKSPSAFGLVRPRRPPKTLHRPNPLEDGPNALTGIWRHHHTRKRQLILVKQQIVGGSSRVVTAPHAGGSWYNPELLHRTSRHFLGVSDKMSEWTHGGFGSFSRSHFHPHQGSHMAVNMVQN
ncbi:uncharacterized protein LOC144052424 [Vanacampus margaritifer]